MSNIVIVVFVQYELVWDLRDKTDEHDHKEYRKTVISTQDLQYFNH